MALRRPPSVIPSLVLGLAVLFSTFAAAQETTAPEALVGDPVSGMNVYKKIGYCVNCHGWAGDGKAGSNPMSHASGADLRVTQLDPEGLAEVIRCGLPGTKMPYHEAAAYRDDRCYGMVMADFDAGSKPIRGKTFREQQLADLMAYLLANVVGQGEPTLEQCITYYEASADKACAYLKTD